MPGTKWATRSPWTNRATYYHTGTFLNGIELLDPGIGVDEITVAGDQAGYVIKQANDGTYLWGEHFVGNVMPSQLCVAPNGDVVVVGSYVNAADLDPGPGTYIMGGEDWPWLFICRLNPQGELLWAKRSGDNNGMWPPSVVIDAFDRVHLTGSFVGEIDAEIRARVLPRSTCSMRRSVARSSSPWMVMESSFVP